MANYIIYTFATERKKLKIELDLSTMRGRKKETGVSDYFPHRNIKLRPLNIYNTLIRALTNSNSNKNTSKIKGTRYLLNKSCIKIKGWR